jgi:hypothetical protein
VEAGARTAQVLVGEVLQTLIGGVGVDCRHQTVGDADRVVDHPGDRCQAVGRAGGVGDHVVLGAVINLVEVDAEHDGRIGIGGGGGDDHLAGALLQMRGGACAVGEQAGRLDHDVDAQLTPGQRAGIALGEDSQLAAVHLDGAVASVNLAGIGA